MQAAPKRDVTAHAPHVATWHFVEVENTRTFRQYNWFSFPIFSTYTVAGRLLLLEILYNHFILFWQSLVLGISFNPTGSSSSNNFVLAECLQVFSHVHKVTNTHKQIVSPSLLVYCRLLLSLQNALPDTLIKTDGKTPVLGSPYK